MAKTLDDQIKNIDTLIDSGRAKNKDSETTKVTDNVFDEATLKALYTLSSKGIIEALGGPISTGKEANVFLADGKDHSLAVKIYRITSSTFNSMEDYIMGDPRFRDVRHTKKDLIFAWTKKEYRNLLRAGEAGIKVPKPIITERNILVMEFIGKDEKPYPLLKDVQLDEESARKVFDILINYIKKLYEDAELIHGDLSEYNVLIETELIEPILIDMGQSVTLEHPRADQFLRRDIQNIARHFRKYGIKSDETELYLFVTKDKKEQNHDSH
ncbi:serine protein kinase RIO [uncultured Methanomethylovorans sp.]|uniref:serine protein kinase RIO n=1 Tax=uncultured Methanomethylovorans sp. TaxID=183759 RepID=UPI002AA69638|nr:serine protein kinase RIO [uncultured Methanomethylovorans sp.]